MTFFQLNSSDETIDDLDRMQRIERKEASDAPAVPTTLTRNSDAPTRPVITTVPRDDRVYPRDFLDTALPCQGNRANVPPRNAMKARIIITPKKAVLDPQGKTVQTALEHLGCQGVQAVHVGKFLEIDLAPGTSRAAAEQSLTDAAHRFLSNPVIEDFRLEIE